MGFIHSLLRNDYFVWGAMAVIVFAVTQGLKWLLVKPYTNKLNKKAKNIVNSVILLIAFGCAVGVEFLYANFYLKTGIDLARAVSGWGGASLVYDLFERIVKWFEKNKVVENPYKTEAGKAVTELVEEISADGKVDGNDKHAVADFWNKVK